MTGPVDATYTVMFTDLVDSTAQRARLGDNVADELHLRHQAILSEVVARHQGTVVKTTTFGAFISLSPGKDGLLHISQIRRLVGGKRVEKVEDVLGVGQKVQVEIGEIDPRGKLSLHAVVEEDAAAEASSEKPADA